MTTTLKTKLEIKTWDEKPYRAFDDGRKFTRTNVVLAGTGEGISEGHFDSLMHYRADGTTTYVSVLQLTGEVDGREGTVVLQGHGTYDGTTARLRLDVVDATGELRGLRGSGESVSTHADYPFMPLTLTYEVE